MLNLIRFIESARRRYDVAVFVDTWRDALHLEQETAFELFEVYHVVSVLVDFSQAGQQEVVALVTVLSSCGEHIFQLGYRYLTILVWVKEWEHVLQILFSEQQGVIHSALEELVVVYFAITIKI